MYIARSRQEISSPAARKHQVLNAHHLLAVCHVNKPPLLAPRAQCHVSPTCAYLLDFLSCSGRPGGQVMLAAGDTFRAAAAEQLKTWADRSGTQFYGPSRDKQRPDSLMYQAPPPPPSSPAPPCARNIHQPSTCWLASSSRVNALACAPNCQTSGVCALYRAQHMSCTFLALA